MNSVQKKLTSIVQRYLGYNMDGMPIPDALGKVIETIEFLEMKIEKASLACKKGSVEEALIALGK